jgi:hypothetical protein
MEWERGLRASAARDDQPQQVLQRQGLPAQVLEEPEETGLPPPGRPEALAHLPAAMEQVIWFRPACKRTRKTAARQELQANVHFYQLEDCGVNEEARIKFLHYTGSRLMRNPSLPQKSGKDGVPRFSHET